MRNLNGVREKKKPFCCENPLLWALSSEIWDTWPVYARLDPFFKKKIMLCLRFQKW